MSLSHWKLLLIALAALAVIQPAPVMAQTVELHPYAGFYWPSTSSAGHLKDEGTYGMRVGYFLDTNVQVESQVGYMNHFQVRDYGGRSRGWLYTLGASYNFSTPEFPFSRKFAPFISVDAGGITLKTDGYSYTQPGLIALAGGGTLNTVKTITVGYNDTFFNVSYGGGFKSVKAWGPVGFRVEVRGRTIPNFYHGTPTILEATAGLNFTLGKDRPK